MANQNRKNPTEAERKMWNDYLSNDKTGFRFLRQKPIHRFIVDFYCVKLSLAIEIDGDSHNKKLEFQLSGLLTVLTPLVKEGQGEIETDKLM